MSTGLTGDLGWRSSSYTLLAPANRCASRLPSLPGARFFKLVTPRLAPARFGEYLVEAGERPISCPVAAGFEHFLLAVGGDCHVSLSGRSRSLGYRGFAYLPPSMAFAIELAPGATAIWIKRRYEAWPGLHAPETVFGSLPAVAADPTPVRGLVRRELLDPADPRFDFNVSHLEFGPGVALGRVEIRDEEHGLYMTGGGGRVRLGGDEHEVRAEDFIYMAPYCPQGFRAGPEGASYLLYGDVYRDGF